ncbi:MAG: hypothetical protein ABSD44_04100 [Terracidiphilus sp.]
MAIATFPYVSLPLPANEAHPHGSIAHRPLAFATITASNGESIRCIVMPDSGADACLFPLSLAILLKLDVLKLPKTLTGGVGCNANTTYYDTITIDLGSEIVFSAYTGFTQGMDQMGLGLLGQDGFFESYRVEFSLNRRVFTVESV